MQGAMPVMSLPDEWKDQLRNSESETIDNTNGPGVAAYETSDGRVRADIYIGLKLDGYKSYQNISSVDRSINMQFALPPVVSCKSDLDFNPSTDEVIAIKVRNI